MAHYDDLKNKAQEVRNEVKAGANTATRVGTVLEGIVDALEAQANQDANIQESIEEIQNNTSEELKNLVVNDLTTGGSDKALSAEMGKVLGMELDTKAPKVGYAPELKVNFAKELVGRGEATPEVIGGIRPTGVRSIGDGNATITKIKGESVVWNQNNFSVAKTIESHGLTYSLDPLTQTITINGTADSDTTFFGVLHGCKSVPIEHKAYLLLKMQGEVNSTGHVETSLVNNNKIPLESGKVIEGILTTRENAYFRVYFKNGDVFNDFVIHALHIDLTLMFGAGNEPTTIEEFEARKPLGVTNEYNEGTIVSFQGGDIKSVGFNAWDEEVQLGYFDANDGKCFTISDRLCSKNPIKIIPNSTYYKNIKEFGMFYDINMNFIRYHRNVNTFTTPANAAYYQFNIPPEYGTTYKNDICLHLVHSGYRNGDYEPYVDDIHHLPDIKSIKDSNGDILFPYGLLSAGSVHDEITATKAIKRIGVVDMGSLTWLQKNTTTPDGVGTYDYLYASGNLNYYGQAKNAIAINNTYLWVQAKALNVRELPNKSFMFSNTTLYLRDDSYTDVNTFKAAMQGVLLYYELAEPIEVDLPEPLNMTYEAWDFGTEELIHEGATTPLNADIVYQFNAVDRIRENSTKNTDLEAKIAALEAMITQLTTQTTNEGGADNEQPM